MSIVNHVMEDELKEEYEGESIIIKLDHHFGSAKLTNFYRTISKNNSKLLNYHQFHQLFRGKELNTFKPPQLLYRASRDGFSLKSFHKYCDDHFKVVIIVKSKAGDLFGGYTTKNLRLDGDRNVNDDELFTFRFENDKFYAFRLQPVYRDHALYRYEESDAPYLFAFGYCFWVCPNANCQISSGSHQTECYILEECKLPNSNTRYFGNTNFLVEDLEVHKITY
ncbi:predicted protein [Naegleria gruberi]|uniref:Predicted protein n=1 Tax=Naegleria gruberi TaxID=5762 RepID=D2VVN5_NAEGR|nr:uncharacterized protein NAEGRDRAFT_73082 [Naegleria gruberi]EFC39137.1 predicted protein [Naegleria gruberi]|eukprot:XP_002671881.1 predicted protein [Naegleria gruberi strain NEG-M]